MIFNGWYKPVRTFVGDIYWREFFLCSPAIVLVVVLSMGIDPLVSVIMVGAAFSVGFGASRTLGHYRWGAVLLATLGMSVSAFLGSLVGHNLPLLLLLMGLLSATCAYLTSRNNDLWWVSLQVVVAFLVAGYYPQGTDYALTRAALVLAGGLLQLGGMIALAKLFPRMAGTLPPAPATTMDAPLQRKFVTAVVLSVVLSFVIAQLCGLSNDYWAPMTVLMVMRPSGQQIFSRAVARLVGTFVGCSLATLIIYGFDDQLGVLLLCLVLSSGMAFSLQKANYGVLSGMISASVVFLIALGFGDPISTTEHRLIATLLGGCVALLVVKLFKF